MGRLPIVRSRKSLSPRIDRAVGRHAPRGKEMNMAFRILPRVSALTILAALIGWSGADAKTLRVNLNADPAQIDPITYSELNAYQVLEQVYEGFTAITPDG